MGGGAADIERELEENPHESSELHQTSPNLAGRTEPHWQALFTELRRRFVELIRETRLAIGHLTLTAWGVGDWKTEAPRLLTSHTHSPALLSAVYYLRVPASILGGTYFEIPQMGPFFGNGEPGLELRPRTGDLVVFPGWLPHASAFRVGHEDTVTSSDARLIIAINAFYGPGTVS